MYHKMGWQALWATPAQFPTGQEDLEAPPERIVAIRIVAGGDLSLYARAQADGGRGFASFGTNLYAVKARA